MKVTNTKKKEKKEVEIKIIKMIYGSAISRTGTSICNICRTKIPSGVVFLSMNYGSNVCPTCLKHISKLIEKGCDLTEEEIKEASDKLDIESPWYPIPIKGKTLSNYKAHYKKQKEEIIPSKGRTFIRV